MTILAISGLIRPVLESRLPEGLDVRWFMSAEEALIAVADAEIGWFDMNDQKALGATLVAAKKLKSLNSIYAGLDFLPMDVLIERNITVTNGAGINATTIAEYAVMGMLTIAKGYRDVVRAQNRHEWLLDSPGKVELAGSSALIIGAGAIGGLVCRMLVLGFGRINEEVLGWTLIMSMFTSWLAVPIVGLVLRLLSVPQRFL